MKIRHLRIGLLAVVAVSILGAAVLGQEPGSPTPQPTVTATSTESANSQTQTPTPEAVSSWYKASPQRIAAAVIGAMTMITGLVLVFSRLKATNQGFGPNELKALGLVLFLPTLIIVAVAVPDFEAETLAALLGTVAGYVLSHSKPEDTDERKAAPKPAP